MTNVDLSEVTALAGEDPRAARILATAEADRVTAEQNRIDADAAAARQLRVEAHRAEQAATKRAAARDDQAAAAELRRNARTARRTDRQIARAARRAWIAGRLDYARTNSAAVYSTSIYGLAVAGAVYGQITAATGRGWPLIVGIVGAAALEGLAVSMALTGHQLRLAGERAIVPRFLTWLCALIAAGINYAGHAATDQVGAIMLASLSLAAITVWEVRTGAKHRRTLRALGAIPDPPAQFGWRRWVRYPWSTLGAWSRDVQSRVSPRAAELFAMAERDRRRALVVKLARRELRRASGRKDGPAVVEILVRLADGLDPATVVPSPSVPSAPAAPSSAPSVPSPSAPPSRPAVPSRPKSAPDVSALLPSARTIRDRLVEAGRPFTRDALVSGLRAENVSCSNARASAVLAALNGKPLPASSSRTA